ncbi:DMT family transporter [Bacillus inaquosorum]|uniref:DMT family transporter n=1 Tax=Bacillus inaquosorum TaxID=483913 RepID=UPI0022826036|nr:DMT family transporter [Bacillus inaquosorum]
MLQRNFFLPSAIIKKQSPPRNWIMVVSTGIIHTVIVYLLFFGSLRFLSTKFISIIVFLDPAVAIVLDTVFTGFHPDLYQTLGIVMIFAGMALTLVRRRGKADVVAENSQM